MRHSCATIELDFDKRGKKAVCMQNRGFLAMFKHLLTRVLTDAFLLNQTRKV